MERPILFSGEMVKAILAGRKTQTRRVVKQQAWVGQDNGVYTLDKKEGVVPLSEVYGKTGDLLWVRETWCPANSENGPVVCYRADYHRRYLSDESYPVDYERFPAGRNAWSCWASDLESGIEGAWRPSIFMPRWASRITLRITEIRVERLQEITEEDAKAEGVAGWHDTPVGTVYRPEFQMLWDRINGKRAPWASNPWVWVVGFDVIKSEGS